MTAAAMTITTRRITQHLECSSEETNQVDQHAATSKMVRVDPQHFIQGLQVACESRNVEPQRGVVFAYDIFSLSSS